MIHVAETKSPNESAGVSIRFLNASPDVPAVDIYVNDQAVVRKLEYKNFTEYYPAKAGVYHIAIMASGPNSAVRFSEHVELTAKTIYTMAVTGISADIGIHLIRDTIKPIQKDKAYIRFINESPYETSFDIKINGHTVVEDLFYNDTTNYYIVNGGTYTLKILNHHTAGLALTNPHMTLAAGKMYACCIVGYERGEPSMEVLLPLEGATYTKLEPC